jgi:hypothetical protein
MCRNIRLLLNFDPPTTDEEIRAAALQFVRKVTGTRAPAKANEATFERAVQQLTVLTRELLENMEVKGPVRIREEEIAKARARNAKRFGPPKTA